MLEAMIGSILGSFFYENVEFFKTVKEQRERGYKFLNRDQKFLSYPGFLEP